MLQGVFARSVAGTVQARRTLQEKTEGHPGGQPSGQPRSGQLMGTIQRRPGTEAFQVNLTPKSGGWPLPREVQTKMESALGANFSDVRIHVGPEATAIGAIAFTWGTDIHFAPGQYNPHTHEGQALLGHELTHVVQQRAGRVANPFGSGVAVVQDLALEAEADRMGRQAAMHRIPDTGSGSASSPPVSVPTHGGHVVNRKTKPAAMYAVRGPLRSGSGWHIDLAAQGTPQPVGSVQLRPSENGVYISDLKVSAEHRRQGLATQLMDAALRTARSNGYHVAQLEARPDSPGDVARGALVSMYRKLGFRTTGMSKRGNPLMERMT